MRPYRIRIREDAVSESDDGETVPWSDDLGINLLNLLGTRGCVELLAVLELPESERAKLIGLLYESE